jgi:hypothetical protein
MTTQFPGLVQALYLKSVGVQPNSLLINNYFERLID